jgi:hypothetical protein
MENKRTTERKEMRYERTNDKREKYDHGSDLCRKRAIMPELVSRDACPPPLATPARSIDRGASPASSTLASGVVWPYDAAVSGTRPGDDQWPGSRQLDHPGTVDGQDQVVSRACAVCPASLSRRISHARVGLGADIYSRIHVFTYSYRYALQHTQGNTCKACSRQLTLGWNTTPSSQRARWRSHSGS